MQRKKIDNVYPFTAIVGQEKMKEAIVLNLINPALGGVLIRGQKGTAKTTVVRAIPNLMRKLKIEEIPANATEDRVAGTIYIEAALKDGEKKFEIPEQTLALMERLAGYTLVGFHVKSYPVTDELLAPFAGHKSMANFGVEDGALTDACFPVFSAMPKLRYLLLDGNAAIHGSSLSALQGCKLDLLTLNRTGLDDAGLLQAASISKLSHIQIDHTAVTYEGLLASAGNNRIEPVAHVQFTQEQMEHFFQLQREKAKKPVQLDEQAAAECRRVLSAFFAEMTQWEQYMEQVGFEDAEAVPRLLAIWEKYVSEKPRPGYRPLGLSYSAQGTYNGEEFLDAEQITKNKLYIYTREKNTGFDRRFLMKRVGEGWKIDAVQERLNGWQRTEV